MMRSDSEAWLKSYISTMEEFYTKHMPMFYNILPWLSRTHSLLSENTNKQNIDDMTLFGRQIKLLVSDSSNWSRLPSKAI